MVLDANAAAASLFGDLLFVRNRRLRVADRAAQASLDTLIDRLRGTPHNAALPVAPIIARCDGEPRLLIRVLPVDGPASGPFLGARALLTLTDLRAAPRPRSSELASVFGLTPAEARLASIVADSVSPETAAEELCLSRETVRNQLKAVFAKTGAHRQAELVALLSRL